MIFFRFSFFFAHCLLIFFFLFKPISAFLAFLLFIRINFFFLFQCLAYFVSIPFFFFSRYYYFSFFEFFFPYILSFLISYIGYSTQQNRIAYFMYELIFIRTCKFAICILKLRQLCTTSWKTCRSRNEINLIFELILSQIQSSNLKHI